MKFICPIYIELPRKRKKNKTVPMSVNWYRNAHFQELNQAKVLFKEIMKERYPNAEPIGVPVKLRYAIYLKFLGDYGNVRSIVEKFFLDFLVEEGWIPEDSCLYVIGDETIFKGFDRNNPRCEVEIF